MLFDVVEIGTSDFRITSLESKGRCILVEPVKFYLDRIENRANIIKVNAAVSDTSGKANVYYSDLSVIETRRLPDWLRGCNSINAKHPTVVNLCAKMGISEDELIKKMEIDTITPETLFSAYDIDEINFLKVDTEGHDLTIMNAIFNLEKMPLIKKIQFETNVLTDMIEYKKFIEKVQARYSVSRTHTDTILTLKI